MKYLMRDQNLGDADCSEDAVKPTSLLEAKLAELSRNLESHPDAPATERAKWLLDSGYILLDLERQAEAYQVAREAFALAAPEADWEQAVQACDIMAQTDHAEAVKGLAHGIWLGVTFPVDPELTVAMLQHFIDQTPPEADGAAVAAATACYVADLRAEGKKRDDLTFFTGQMIGEVARRHKNVDSQELFDFWMERFELNDPAKFLPRMAQILDVLVVDEWWIDRDRLRDELPEE